MILDDTNSYVEKKRSYEEVFRVYRLLVHKSKQAYTKMINWIDSHPKLKGGSIKGQQDDIEYIGTNTEDDDTFFEKVKARDSLDIYKDGKMFTPRVSYEYPLSDKFVERYRESKDGEMHDKKQLSYESSKNKVIPI